MRSIDIQVPSDWETDPNVHHGTMFKMTTSMTPFLMPNYFQRPTLLPLSRQLHSFTRLFTSTAISRHEDSTKNYRHGYNWIRGVETLERYEPGGFHPVIIGNVLHDRYYIVDKLGFGGYSTVWLARDMHQQEYVAVKVGIAKSTSASSRESKCLQALEASSLLALVATMRSHLVWMNLKSMGLMAVTHAI